MNKTYKEELEIAKTALDTKQVNCLIQQGKFTLEEAFTFVKIWNKIKRLSQAFVVTDTSSGKFWIEIYDLRTCKGILTK